MEDAITYRRAVGQLASDEGSTGFYFLILVSSSSLAPYLSIVCRLALDSKVKTPVSDGLSSITPVPYVILHIKSSFFLITFHYHSFYPNCVLHGVSGVAVPNLWWKCTTLDRGRCCRASTDYSRMSYKTAQFFRNQAAWRSSKTHFSR